jgi:hypothetical protein
MMDIVMYIIKIVEEQQATATDDETPLGRIFRNQIKLIPRRKKRYIRTYGAGETI